MPRKVAKAVLARAYRDVFGTPEGKMVLADIMGHCGVYRPVIPTDGTTMAFCEGQRNVALMITTYLAYKPSDFVDHAKQHQEHLTYE